MFNICVTCFKYRHQEKMRKFRRIFYRVLNLILVISFCGFFVPFIIFWRGEYFHRLKSSWVQGEMCEDIVLSNMAVNLNENKRNLFRNVTIHPHGWRAIDGKNIFYMYSSFYFIDRDTRYILIIGALDKRTYDDLQCAITDNTVVKYVPATYMAMWDDQLLCSRTNHIYTALWSDKILCRYSPAFFTCPLPKNFRPNGVTLSQSYCKYPTNMVEIVYPSSSSRKFTICIAPLFGPYDNIHELIHMIELNRILGADHFTFYNYNISSRVDRVLNYYKDLGIVDNIIWNMPLNVSKIHYYGQMAALNDCLYRNRYKSKYIVVQDLDEFIIPANFRTWTEMMLDLPHGLNSYSFQSTQFSIDLPDTEVEFHGKDIAVKYELASLLKLKQGPIYDQTTRTKYIVEASRVAELGIHNTWRLQSGSSGNEYHVSPEDGVMFHYRHWFGEKEKFTGKQNSKMLKYKDELITNVKKTYEKIKLS